MNYEKDYAKLLQETIEEGEAQNYRNGIRISNCFTRSIHCDTYAMNILPMLYAKKVFAQTACVEMCSMIRGITDVSWLRERGCNWWNDWEDESGHIPNTYAHQMRHFSSDTNEVDQLARLIDQLKEQKRTGIAHSKNIISFWQAADLDCMPLTPCHTFVQFFLRGCNQKLDLVFHQASSDVFLGLPHNMIGYTFLLAVVSRILNVCAGSVQVNLGDTHVYASHINACNEYLNKLKSQDYKASEFMNIVWTHGTFDIDTLDVDDWSIKGDYEHMGYIPAELIV